MKLDISMIRNYYENEVFSRVSQRKAERAEFNDESAYLDVACVALNRLPPRYIRHDADMFFYMSNKERAEVHAALDEAVAGAFEFVIRKQAKAAAPRQSAG